MTYQSPPNGWRTFLIVWTTQSVSVFGSALTFFAVTIWLTQVLYPAPEQKPELAFALSAISLAFALPTVFGAPIAGAWADRHDRKRTMMATDLMSGCMSLLAAALMATQALQLWMLIAIVIVDSMLAAFAHRQIQFGGRLGCAGFHVRDGVCFGRLDREHWRRCRGIIDQ